MARKFEVKSCGHTEIGIDLCEFIVGEDGDGDRKITGVKIDNEVLIFIFDQIKEKFIKPKNGRILIEKSWDEYPVGTKAHASGGGHWTKTERGWKFCNGATFPTPGGDAVAVTLPE